MATKFLLAVSEQFNMYSSWSDELYCSILKDGSLSLKARKDGGYGGRWWFNLIKGIRTPKQFIDGFESIAEIETGSWSLESDILPELFLHLPKFAVSTNKFIENVDEYGDEEMEFFHFFYKLLLNSDYTLPEGFDTAVKTSRSFSILRRSILMIVVNYHLALMRS